MKRCYEICACLQDVDGKLLDRSKPFKTYYIESSSAKNAVNDLKKSLPGMTITVYGEPVLMKGECNEKA